jgi:hypothetical protein
MLEKNEVLIKHMLILFVKILAIVNPHSCDGK